MPNDFLRLFATNNLLAISFKLLGMVQILAKMVNDSVLKGKINQLIGWLERSVKIGINHEDSTNEKYLPGKKARKKYLFGVRI